MIKRDNSLFLDYWFTSIEPFNNGYAKVVFKNDSISNILDNEYIMAYVDHNGKQLLNRWYSGGGSFKNGKAKVSISNEYFYLDTIGQLEYRSYEECDEATPFNIDHKVDKKARFPSGELGLLKTIKKNLRYPKAAKK